MADVRIETILGGQSQIQNFALKGGFDTSIAIDPDMPIADSVGKPSGFIRPTSMEKFSGSTITSAVKFLVTNPKDSNIYAYAENGLVHSISSSLSMNSNVGTPTSGAGNGAGYYDNYLYLATPTNISRYGPLDGSPSITNSYWTSTLSKAALTNTTYPSINGRVMPNHVMHRHTDNKLYICDVLSNTTANTNKGAVHYITSSKTTVEGDTNSASAYNALDFDYGYYPTCIESYGTDLVVAGFEGTNTTTEQSRAWVTFWDTTSSSFQKLIQVEFPDPLITAMKNVNGTLYVWSGSATGGCRLSVFIGGYSFQELWYNKDMYPPLAGAVDGKLNRVIWGTTISLPEAATCVMAYGSLYQSMGKGVQNILKTTSAGSTSMVTALKYTTQNTFVSPIVCWADASSQGADKLSTTYNTSVWRSEIFRFGSPGVVNQIRIPMAQALSSNMTIVPKVIVDEGTSNTLTTINSTNYPGDRNIVIMPAVNFKHSFQIELRQTGSALCTVGLPISINIVPREE